jgi:transposase-like protein
MPYKKWPGETLPAYEKQVVTNPNFKCPDCGERENILGVELDDVYDDWRYVCATCRCTWVVEGADS